MPVTNYDHLITYSLKKDVVEGLGCGMSQNEGPHGVWPWHPCSQMEGFQESYLKFLCLLCPVDQVSQEKQHPS